MRPLLRKLIELLRGRSAPPQPRLEEGTGQDLSPARLDAALARLRAETRETDDQHGER